MVYSFPPESEIPFGTDLAPEAEQRDFSEHNERFSKERGGCHSLGLRELWESGSLERMAGQNTFCDLFFSFRFCHDC